MPMRRSVRHRVVQAASLGGGPCVVRTARLARSVLLLVAALLMPGIAVPSVARAAQTTATIMARVRVFQEYKVDVSGLQNAFEYVIEPVESDAPMPVDADGTFFDRFTLTREEAVWLEFPVEVTVDPAATPCVYHYTMRPVEESLPDGLYYVDVLSTNLEAGVNKYPLEIHVQPSSVDAAVSLVTPTVHVDGWDGPKVADPGWRVSYREPEDTPEDEPGNGDDSSEPEDDGPSSDGEGTGSGEGSGERSASASRKGSSTGSTGSTARTTLATTGDALGSRAMPVGLLGVGASLLACAALLRGRAGDDHA